MKTKKALLSMLVVVLMIFNSCQNPMSDSGSDSSDSSNSRAVQSVKVWQEGIYLTAGEEISYNNASYLVKMSHTAHYGWLPDGAGMHAVFEKLSFIDPKVWEAGIYVNAGEVIKHNGLYYEVIVAHTCHYGWQPGAPGLSTVFKLTDAPIPGNLFYLKDMLTAFPNVIEGDVLKYGPVGTAKATTIYLDNQSIDIAAGEKLVLNIKIEKLTDNYGDPTFRPYFIMGGDNYFNGAFEKINFNGNTAEYLVAVDNVNVSGVITRLGFNFYDIVSDELKITNLSYEVKASDMPAATSTTPYPNRLGSHTYSLDPAYTVSTDERLTQANLEAEMQRLFEEWRAHYLLEADFANAEGQVGKYFRYQGGVEGMPPGMTPVTTSESHGYGMLLLAHMDNGINNTRDDFDAMVDYYLQWMSNEPSLAPIMDWQQAVATETTTFNVIQWLEEDDYAPSEGPELTVEAGHLYTTPTMWNDDEDLRCHGGFGGAADGDMDIAYALLIADKQWGSDGRHNYLELATEMIDMVKKIYIATENNSAHLMLASFLQEWGAESTNEMYWGTRSSDFLLSHYEAFGKLTNDQEWRDITTTTRDLLAVQANSISGIYPDFYYTDDQGENWYLPDTKVLETNYDGGYFWNACRTPWRVTTKLFENFSVSNYAYQQSVEKFNQFVAAQGGPKELYTGYTKDGVPVPGYKKQGSDEWEVWPAVQDENIAFAAPAFLSSIYRGGLTEAQILENYLYIMDDANLRPNTPDEPYAGYYDSIIRMFTLLVYTGNWIQM